jgi:hypothetical protein
LLQSWLGVQSRAFSNPTRKKCFYLMIVFAMLYFFLGQSIQGFMSWLSWHSWPYSTFALIPVAGYYTSAQFTWAGFFYLNNLS